MNQQRFDAALSDASHAGVYRASQRERASLAAAAARAGYALYRIDLGNIDNKQELLDRLATALGFPDWFGHNWDALQDCLTDLSWQTARGHLLIVEHCDAFRAVRGDDFATLMQVLDAAATYWREERVPFWTMVDTRVDGIARLPGIT